MKIPKFFWTTYEGKWIAFDKFCHLILHFGIVVGCRLLGANLILAFLISQAWGWFYEWFFDCYFYGIIGKLPILKRFQIGITGASKKDIICNTLGGVIGLVI